MFDTIGPAWLLASTFVRSLLLLVFCSLAIWGLRRFVWKGREINSEHRVWLFLLAAMYALPLLVLVAPDLPIPIALLPQEQAIQTQPSSSSVLQAEASNDADAQVRLDRLPSNGTPTQPKPLTFGGPTDTTSATISATELVTRASSAPPATSAKSNQPSLTNSPEASRTTKPFLSFSGAILLAWLLGTAVLLLRFLVAWRQVHELVVQAKPIVIDEHAKIASLEPQALRSVRVLESSSISSPVVVGCFGHRIILPADWQSWTSEKLRSVFAHELSHVRRRDGLVSLLAELNSILHWPSPAAWITKMKLARLAEFACDQEAARTTGDRNQYARHLLEIASLQREPQVQAGIAMAGSTEIGLRVERILDRAVPLARSTSMWFMIALVLLGTPGLLVLAAVTPTPPAESTSEQTASASLDMSGHKWYRTEGERRFLSYRMQVLNPDGSVAKDVNVRARSKEELKVTKRDGYFEFDFELQPGFQPGIRALATSEDGQLIGHHAGDYDAATHDAKNGISITLKPAREITVQVSDDDQVIADANVGIDWTGGFETFAKTNTDGEATFRIPVGAKLQRIGAWTADHRIGGYQFARKPVRDPLAPTHQVKLHPCVQRTIRVVDDSDRPVSNLDFELHIADLENYNYIPLFERGTFTTNEQGEAICDWFPDWKQMHAYIDLQGAEQWSKTQDDSFKDGVLVSRLEQNAKLKRVTVSGRVQLPEGMEHSFLVKLGSFEHPEEGRYDSLHCRTDAQGYFSVDVMPGATYCAFIVDQDWVSTYWTGIAFDPKTQDSKLVELDIMKGEPVEIVATAGPNRSPLANLTLSLRQGHDFEWIENFQRQSGSLGRQWWVTTDENGKALTYANPGEISAWASQNDWQPRVESEVIPGEVTRLEFHRRSAGKRMVSGVVTSGEISGLDLDDLEVHLIPMDGESRDEATATVNASGQFQAELSAAVVGAWVYTPDRGAFAATISEQPDKGIRLNLEPTTTFHGRYVDSAGKPLVGKWVRMSARFENAELENNSPYAYSGKSLSACEAVTDEDGNFSISGVPFEMPLGLRCEEANSNPSAGEVRSKEDRGRFLGNRYLIQGEQRPPEIIQSKAEDEPKASIESLSDDLDEKIIDGRLMGAR
ncbi:MAG: M56 family metallopeptidase, partial [Planctomycetota bacterium]